MNFAFNETQRMLSESIARYLAREKPRGGFQQDQWKHFADMGLLGLTVSEDFGGMGGSPIDVAAVMEQLGRGAGCAPYVFGGVMASALLEFGNETQRHRWLSALATGEELFACAMHENKARHDLLPMTTSAEGQGPGFVLNGTKSNVWHAEHASKVIIAAQHQGGLTLFVLPTSTPGLQWHHFPTVDGGSASELRLEGVQAGPEHLLGKAGQAHDAIRLAERRATAALAAESVGLMAVMHESTVDYSRQRQQFGQAIGGFQALQHRMVDMLIELEQARSLAWYAAASFDSHDDRVQQRAVSAAKARAGRAGRLVAHEAIQLHGGMGMTEELALARYVRRQLAIEQSLGDTAFHTACFSQIDP